MSKCFFHSESDAVAVCSDCGKHLCRDCAVSLAESVYCKECLEAMVTAVQNREPNLAARSAFLTFVLSLVPGLGHLYQGFTNKGYQLLLTFFGFISLTMQFHQMEDFMVFVIPLLFFYSIFDAQWLRRKILSGMPVDPQQGFFAGSNHMELLAIILIALGGLGVIEQVSRIYPPLYGIKTTVENILPPSLLILAGIYLLRKRKTAELNVRR